MRALLWHSQALTAPVWSELFRALPPRGTVARLARRLGARLHDQSKPWRWSNKAEVRKEVRKMARWYRPGRKKVRRRKLVRDAQQNPELRGLTTAWNDKVRRHFKSFTSKLRLSGMWAWRKVARMYHLAGVPCQTGAVSVERTWYSMLSMVPPWTRCMSVEWWRLVAALCFVRHNIRHYRAAGHLPAWAEGDHLLLARVDAMMSLTRRALAGEPLNVLPHFENPA